MNDKECQKEISLLIESSNREQWSDEALSHFHHTALKIISVTIESEGVFLPMGVYYRYKKYVNLTDIAYANMEKKEPMEMLSDNQKEMCHNYLKQAEVQYGILCRLIASAYRLTTYPEERDNLYDLAHDINRINKEY